MEQEKRLDYLIQYHRNLSEQSKADNSVPRKTELFDKLKQVEKEIDEYLFKDKPTTVTVGDIIGREVPVIDFCQCGNPSGRRYPKMIDGQFSSEFYCKDCNGLINI